MVLMLLVQRVCSSAMVKLKHLKYKFSINRLLLLVRCQEMQKFKYQTSLESCWLLFFFLTIFLLPSLKNSWSKLSFVKAVILAQFHFAYRCLMLDNLFDLFLLTQLSGNMQSRLQFSSFSQLKYLLLLFALFLTIEFWPFNIIAKFLVTLIAHLLINFALVEVRIYCILSIDLFFHSHIFLVIISKLLYKMSSVIVIKILF